MISPFTANLVVCNFYAKAPVCALESAPFCSLKGVFIEKGPCFHGKGALRAPQIPREPPRGVSVWNLGSARGPFTVKKRPLFDENALCAPFCSLLRSFVLVCALLCSFACFCVCFCVRPRLERQRFKVWELQNITLLLLNGLNKDKEDVAPLFKIRRLGLRPLEIPCFLGQNSLIALHPTSLNKEVVLAGAKKHPKTQHTRKRRKLTAPKLRVFGCVAFSGALCSPLGGRQNTPENATHPKSQIWERSSTCVFGCFAFSGAFWRPLIVTSLSYLSRLAATGHRRWPKSRDFGALRLRGAKRHLM